MTNTDESDEDEDGFDDCDEQQAQIKDNEEDGSRVTRVMRNERPNQQVWEWPGKVIEEPSEERR